MGGGRSYNLISDLGVESAMADFEVESIFFTLFQGHLLYYNISPTPNIRHPVIGGGGGGNSFHIKKLFILFFLFLMKSHK